MQVPAEKSDANASQAERTEPTWQNESSPLSDHRPSQLRHKNIQRMANTATKTHKTTQLQQLANAQAPHHGAAIQKNNTGLPDNLKNGMENLSGMSLDHVKVHYNSDKPASVQAHAYAQGSEIHVASGQEQHLPHELGHVVQQAQGRVQPTTSVDGMAVNDNPSLEHEATQMGDAALQRAATEDVNMPLMSEAAPHLDASLQQFMTDDHAPVQRSIGDKIKAAWQAIKDSASIKSVALGLEGIGHVTAGVLLTLAGTGAITSVALAPAGIAAVLGGIGQMIIGVSKWIRASILGHANLYKDGKPSSTQKKWISALTAVEGAIATATSIAGSLAASGAIAAISKAVGAFGAFVKTIRGVASFFEGCSKRIAAWSVYTESLIGYFSTLSGILASGTGAIVGVVGMIVNIVKNFRGGTMVEEASYPSEQQRTDNDATSTDNDNEDASTQSV